MDRYIIFSQRTYMYVKTRKKEKPCNYPQCTADYQ